MATTNPNTWNLDDTGSGRGDMNPTEPPTPAPGEVVLNLALSTPGRIGFYMDYSELDAAGTHTFWICRTHGTTGAVSVDYQTAGDTHTPVSGTLTWQNGEANVKPVQVPVTALDLSTHDAAGLGEHRIVMTLSSPTSGAALHRLEHTRAYGIVDSAAMIASDANAYFINFDSGTNGIGTETSPFNTFAAARDAQNASRKRYIYGQGTSVPEELCTGELWGLDMDEGGAVIGGTSETDRTTIMAWPGFTWTHTRRPGFFKDCGFYCDTSGTCNYLTIKGITFTDLSSRDQTVSPRQCWAFWPRSDFVGQTIERCVMDGIESNAVSGTGAVYDDIDTFGLNVYRCLFQNITKYQSSNDVMGFESYDGGEKSIQNCTFNNCFIYEKDSPQTGRTALTIRFTRINNGQMQISGLSRGGGSNHVIQGNYITTQAQSGIWFWTSGSATGAKHWIVGNILDNCGTGTGSPSIRVQDGKWDGLILFNNIWQLGQAFLRVDVTGAPRIDYLDYNHEFNVGTAGSWRWDIDPIEYADTAALQAGTSYATGQTFGDPLFDASFRLGGGSPAAGTGLSNTDHGVYLIGDQILGYY